MPIQGRGRGTPSPPPASVWSSVILSGKQKCSADLLRQSGPDSRFPRILAYIFLTHPSYTSQSLQVLSCWNKVHGSWHASIPAESGPLVSLEGQRQKDYASFQWEAKLSPSHPCTLATIVDWPRKEALRTDTFTL